jgi:hypothetical protein
MVTIHIRLHQRWFDWETIEEDNPWSTDIGAIIKLSIY